MCSWHPRIQKAKTLLEFSNAASEKDRPSRIKWLLFVGHVLYRERDNKPCLKFHTKKVVFFIYRMVPKRLDLGG
jgi:hypothetical protein